MVQQAMAEIIPFPTRRGPVAMPLARDNGQERLARALASLTMALSEQRAAVTAWRETLGQLKSTTDSLGAGLRRYHSSLEALGSQVASLRDEAVKLEAWADQVLAGPG